MNTTEFLELTGVASYVLAVAVLVPGFVATNRLKYVLVSIAASTLLLLSLSSELVLLSRSVQLLLALGAILTMVCVICGMLLDLRQARRRTILRRCGLPLSIAQAAPAPGKAGN